MTYTTNTGNVGSALNRMQSNRFYSLALLVLLSGVTLALWQEPWAEVVLRPITTFVTTVHEMGHALVCLATGGTVTGMTIVSDNRGHDGLTFCAGGWPLLYSQTGYLGAAFFGCLLILLGQYQRIAKAILCLMGLAICGASLTFMFGTVLHGEIFQGLGSMFWGLVLGAALIWSGLKLNHGLANFVLIFLAVQTALNAVTDVIGLTIISLGFQHQAAFSDATNMAAMTGVPAPVWSILWGLISMTMLGVTLWICYGPRGKSKAGLKI